jgi:uncharacterized repeat protein (TIGR03806 family)
VWCTDRGATVDEFGPVAAGSNHGWPTMDGATCVVPGCNDDGALTAPLVALDGACDPAGIAPVRAARLPELQGAAVFTCGGAVRALRFDGRLLRSTGDIAALPGARVVGEDDAGDTLVVDDTGALVRFARPAAASAPTFPATLSQTGCFADVAARTPASGLVPYEVRVPLWSDGAEKRRFVALPDGAAIGFAVTGPWSFPDGTIFVKEFLHPGSLRAMETRFLVKRTNASWEGYSFMWNRAGTEAYLLDGSEIADWPDGTTHTHVYPDRGDCLLCHNNGSGRALGLVTGQMNATHDYDGVVDNQLRAMEHVGLFTAPLPASPAALPQWPALDDDGAPVETRARAWLAGNCQHCHKPGGLAPTVIDLRFETELADTNTCDVNPLGSNLGVAGAKLVKPGASSESVVYLRAARRGAQQMPPVATRVLDDAGLAIVQEFIDTLAECPP